jgi:hypothetical protein
MQQPAVRQSGIDRGLHVGEERHRPLMQGSGCRPGRVALDAAVGGVGCACRDAGDLERAGVHPHAVMVSVTQRDGPVGHHAVEGLGHRRAAREERHRPPGAEDPGLVGMGVRVLRDDAQAVLSVESAGQVALQQLDTGLHGVDVRVLEARQQHPAAQIDDLGHRARHVRERARFGDREDRSGAHGDVTGPRALPGRGEDGPAGEDGVGEGHG